MWQLLQNIRWPRRDLLIVTVILSMNSATSLIMPLMLGRIVERISDARWHWNETIPLLALFVAGIGASAWGMFLMGRISATMIYELRKRVYAAMLHLNMRFFDAHDSKQLNLLG